MRTPTARNLPPSVDPTFPKRANANRATPSSPSPPQLDFAVRYHSNSGDAIVPPGYVPWSNLPARTRTSSLSLPGAFGRTVDAIVGIFDEQVDPTTKAPMLGAISAERPRQRSGPTSHRYEKAAFTH